MTSFCIIDIDSLSSCPLMNLNIHSQQVAVRKAVTFPTSEQICNFLTLRLSEYIKGHIKKILNPGYQKTYTKYNLRTEYLYYKDFADKIHIIIFYERQDLLAFIQQTIEFDNLL